MQEAEEANGQPLRLNSHEEFVKKLNYEAENLRHLSSFFKEYVSLNKSYGESLLKLSKQLAINFGLRSTLQGSVNTLLKELKEIGTSLVELAAKTTQEELKSLSALLSDFERKKAAIAKAAANTISEAGELKGKVQASYAAYAVSGKSIEKLQRALEVAVESGKNVATEDLFNKTEKVLDARNQARIAKEDYVKLNHEVNEKLKHKVGKYHRYLDEMVAAEKERIASLQKILSSCLKRLENVTKACLGSIVIAQDAFNSINPEEDTKLSLQNFNHTEPKAVFNEVSVVLDREVPFTIRDQYGIYSKTSLLQLEKGTKTWGMKLDLDKIIKNLLAGQVLSLEEKATTISMITSPGGRQIFGDALSKIDAKTMLSPEVFKIFWELINSLLTAVIRDKNSEDLFIFVTILHAGGNLYTVEEEEKRYMLSEIAKHRIWLEADCWKEIIYYVMQKRIKLYKVMLVKNMVLPEDDKYLKVKGFFASKFGSKRMSKTDVMKAMNKPDKNILIDLLRRFIFYFLHFHVSVPLGTEILNYFQRLAYLQPKAIYELKGILRSLQPFPESGDFQYYNKAIGMARHQRKLERYGNSVACFCIGKSLRFISDKKLLLQILLLSKEAYRVLKTEVFKCVLIKLPIVVGSEHRTAIWKQILDVNSLDADYRELKEKVANGEIEISQAVKESIDLDVQRAMPSNPYVHVTSLTNVLTIYAAYNKEINYCQGMSNIVAFLCLVFKDEELAFKFLVSIISKYDMTGMFTVNVPLLKRSFYIMKQFLFGRYPSIIKHLEAEDVALDYFTTGWFMTIFTHTLHESIEIMPPLLLMKVWDAFLLDGWKAVFKVAVHMMNKMEQRAAKQSAANVRTLLVEFPKKEFMQSNSNLAGLLEYLNKAKITNSVIECIGLEYEESKERSEEMKGEVAEAEGALAEDAEEDVKEVVGEDIKENVQEDAMEDVNENLNENVNEDAKEERKNEEDLVVNESIVSVDKRN
eukprot:TRINITY_DN4396_c0_g1_i10.p1 TRINITY_DN4396_c0_g1~~TRINITY_DN4396_c0_g1_i10.p1  ORF type:complete len:979 (-),score=319.71 TRINITY_DN4396_c0_g1_i10:139-3075(-)